jgi:hypothetical protein
MRKRRGIDVPRPRLGVAGASQARKGKDQTRSDAPTHGASMAAGCVIEMMPTTGGIKKGCVHKPAFI